MGIKYMDPQQFIDLGYLHEINRLLLHPLGLALQVSPHADEGRFEAAIWDCREDPEGVEFAPDLLSAEKAANIATFMFARREMRKELRRFVVQPVECDEPTLTTTYINPAERTGGPQRQTFPGIGEVEFEGEET